MRQPIDEAIAHAYPGMVAIVTSYSEGEHNIMASGWHTYIGSDPGTYGISLRKETYSYGLIEKSGAFGINFLPDFHSDWIQAVGTFSGRDMDKFEKYGIAYEMGRKVNVPILKDAYFAYECKVTDIRTHGDHEWISGEIMQTYQDKALFLDNGMPDLSKLNIPLYVGRSNYLTIDDSVVEMTHPLYLEK